jgi:hypothetical protein
VIKKFFMAWILPALFAPSALPADDTLSQKINSLADRYYDFRLRTRPEIAYFSGVEIERHDGLYDNSPEALGREQAMEDELLLALGKIDPASIRGGVDWITYGFLEQALSSARDLRVCRSELWSVSQMNGWQLNYARLAELQPVGTTDLRQQALKRWEKLPSWIDQEIVNLETGLKSGYSAPKAAVRRVIGQLDGVLAIPAADSPFASPAKRDDDSEFSARFIALVDSRILPAVKRYRDYLAGTYLDKARASLAVTANPGGRACYEASLRSYTTLDRSPEEVFEPKRSSWIRTINSKAGKNCLSFPARRSPGPAALFRPGSGVYRTGMPWSSPFRTTRMAPASLPGTNRAGETAPALTAFHSISLKNRAGEMPRRLPFTRSGPDTTSRFPSPRKLKACTGSRKSAGTPAWGKAGRAIPSPWRPRWGFTRPLPGRFSGWPGRRGAWWLTPVFT